MIEIKRSFISYRAIGQEWCRWVVYKDCRGWGQFKVWKTSTLKENFISYKKIVLIEFQVLLKLLDTLNRTKLCIRVWLTQTFLTNFQIVLIQK